MPGRREMDLGEQISVSTTDALTPPSHALASDTTFSHCIQPPGRWLLFPWALASSHHPLPNPDEHDSLVIYSIIYSCAPNLLGVLFILKTISVLQGR